MRTPRSAAILAASMGSGPIVLRPSVRRITAPVECEPGGTGVNAFEAGLPASSIGVLRRFSPRGMPEDAPTAKMEATKSYGAEVVLAGLGFDAAAAAAQERVEAGETYVHAFEDRLVLAGQGTLGLELAEGLGPEVVQARNPRCLVASLSGFGQTGPAAGRASYDIVAQAAGGLMAMTGFPDGPPVRAGGALADFVGGLSLLQIADDQFEQINLVVEFLRRLAEARAPQCRQLRLQLLDMQRLGIELSLQSDRKSAQGFRVGRQFGGRERHADL